MSRLQGDGTPPANRQRAFGGRGGQEPFEKLQKLIDQRGRISGGRGRKRGMLGQRRESFLIEIVFLEWILFFFSSFDKSFFNLIVTDGYNRVPTWLKVSNEGGQNATQNRCICYLTRHKATQLAYTSSIS
jgi:hypothetical protein